jgi:hypothetical protein
LTIQEMPVFPRRFVVFACLATAAFAAEGQVNVIVQGQVAPGVYGRVDIGGAPPPPVVYEAPRIAVPPKAPPPTPAQPIYLHVPPGHAKNWKKHCKKYDACGQPVYFVKSAEYEPKKKKKKDA